MSTRIFGSGIRRREDPRLITGAATYTDDSDPAGDGARGHAAQSACARPHHASIDVARARRRRRASSRSTRAPTSSRCTRHRAPGCCRTPTLKMAKYPCLPRRHRPLRRRHRGGGRRRDAGQAYDALELVEVDYEPLPCVIDPQKAWRPARRSCTTTSPTTSRFNWTVAGGDVDAAFAKAEVVVKETIRQQRLIPNAMEPRAALAKWARRLRRVTCGTRRRIRTSCASSPRW